MTLTGLIPLYQSIRRDNLTYALFDFAKNRVVFHVFFDIDSRPNYKLIILAQGSHFELNDSSLCHRSILQHLFL